jgi:membrane-bound lytic murein transglycosylase D
VNKETLENWPLAVTAYNHGRSSLLRATNRLGTRDLEEIILRNRIRGFGFASSNFYACLIAALEVERNPEKYFGVIDRNRPHRFYEVELPNSIRLKDLVSFMRLPKKKIVALNPGFTDLALASRVKIPKGYRLRVPNEEGSGTERNLASAGRVFLSGFKRIPAIYKSL